MEILRQRDVYDVCTSARARAAAMVAFVLTQAGARAAMLEAGPLWDAVRDTRMLAWPYDSPRRGAPTPDGPMKVW